MTEESPHDPRNDLTAAEMDRLIAAELDSQPLDVRDRRSEAALDLRELLHAADLAEGVTPSQASVEALREEEARRAAILAEQQANGPQGSAPQHPHQ